MKEIYWYIVGICVLLGRVFSIPSPTNTLILYADNWTGDDDFNGVQDSLQIAQYYATKYNVPSTNMLPLTIANFDTFDSYGSFFDTLTAPLNAKITAIGAQNIEVILLVYGIPWKNSFSSGPTSIDSMIWFPSVFTSRSQNPTVYNKGNTLKEDTPSIGGDKPTRFSSTENYSFNTNQVDIYLVTRLDGPGRVWGNINRIDAARYANQYAWFGYGYQNGMVYVDTTGSNPCDVNSNQSALAAQLEVKQGTFSTNLGADANIAYGTYYANIQGVSISAKQQCGSILIGQDGATFIDGTSATSAPNAMLYGGWYAYNTYLSVYDWNPGSAAIDLNSGSLNYNIRSNTPSYAWAWGALNEGVTATAGAIAEPQADGHPCPNIFLYYMLFGNTFAEAALRSMPSFGWYSVYIGDPLLCPFCRSKTPVQDLTAPTFVSGSPSLDYRSNIGYTVEVKVSDSVAVEVVRATVNYGTTPALGSSILSKNWGSWHRITFDNLPANTLIYYQVTVVDPAGFSTTSSMSSFTTGTLAPYNGSPFSIPGTIPFWQFDQGPAGVAYYDIDMEVYSSNAPRVDTGVDIFNYAPYSVCQTFPKEWLSYTVNVAQGGVYNWSFVLDNWGQGYSQLTLNDNNLTQPIFAPQSGSGWASLYLPPGVLQLKWRCISGSDMMVGCGAYQTMTFTLLLADGPSPSVTPSITPSISVSSTPTKTPSPSRIPPSTTPTSSPSKLPSPSRSPSRTPSPITSSSSPSASPALSPSSSSSPSPVGASVTPSVTPTTSVTPSPSTTPSVTPTSSPVSSPSSTSTPSSTASPSSSSSPSSSTTSSPSASSSSTPSSSATSSPSVTPTRTPSPSNTPSSIVSPSPITTPSVTPTNTPSPTQTPSVTPSSSVTSSPSITPAQTPSTTPTVTPTKTPSSTSTSTPSSSSSPSSTPLPVSPSRTPSNTPSSSSTASRSPSSTTTPSRTTSPSASPSPVIKCNAPTPVNCGTFCAVTPLGCVRTAACTVASPFTCYDGSCVADTSSCPTAASCNTNTVECWDGSCASTFAGCPALPPCPIGQIRCGTVCQDTPCTTVASCSSAVCADGSCSQDGYCPRYEGCPVNKAACPDGSCVSNVTQCMCSATEYQCFDGTCSQNCTLAPSLIKPLSYSVYVPSGETSTLSVYSDDGTQIGSVDITPPGGAVLDMQPVPDSVIMGAVGNNTLFSSVISLNLQGIESVSFATPVKICLTFSLPANTNSLPDITCLAFINTEGIFECVSDVTLEGNYACGTTDHFTEFGVGNFKTSSNNNSKNSHDSSSSNAAPFWAWIILVLGLVALLVIAFAVVYITVIKKSKQPEGPAVEMGPVKNPYYEETEQ